MFDDWSSNRFLLRKRPMSTELPSFPASNPILTKLRESTNANVDCGSSKIRAAKEIWPSVDKTNWKVSSTYRKRNNRSLQCIPDGHNYQVIILCGRLVGNRESPLPFPHPRSPNFKARIVSSRPLHAPCHNLAPWYPVQKTAQKLP